MNSSRSIDVPELSSITLNKVMDEIHGKWYATRQVDGGAAGFFTCYTDPHLISVGLRAFAIVFPQDRCVHIEFCQVQVVMQGLEA